MGLPAANGGATTNPCTWPIFASRTPADRVFGLTCTYGGCNSCFLAQLIWSCGGGMPGAATVSKATAHPAQQAQAHPVAHSPRQQRTAHLAEAGVSEHIAHAHGARQLYDKDICAFEPPSALSHSCLIGEQIDRPDRVPPKEAGRNFSALEQVWRYMLTTTSRAGELALAEMSNRTSATKCPRFARTPSGYNFSRPLRL